MAMDSTTTTTTTATTTTPTPTATTPTPTATTPIAAATTTTTTTTAYKNFLESRNLFLMNEPLKEIQMIKFCFAWVIRKQVWSPYESNKSPVGGRDKGTYHRW